MGWARQQRKFFATLLYPSRSRCFWPATSWAHARGQQQRVLPGLSASWLNWELGPEQRELLGFVRGLIGLRAQNPVFGAGAFSRAGRFTVWMSKTYWLTPAGMEMTDKDWNTGDVRCLGMGLPGFQIEENDAQGERIMGDSFLILFNGGPEDVSFRLRARLGDKSRELVFDWELVFDTSSANVTPEFLGEGTWPNTPCRASRSRSCALTSRPRAPFRERLALSKRRARKVTIATSTLKAKGHFQIS